VINTPTISIIVLHYNGRKHLEPRFETLRRLDYPSDKVQILLVGNLRLYGASPAEKVACH
jgi:GT2 family glycosyltransferase